MSMKHVSLWIIPKFRYSKLLWHYSLVDKKPSRKGERNGGTLKNKTILLAALVLEYLLFQKSSCIHTRNAFIFTNTSTFTVSGRDQKEYISIEAIGNECSCVCCATKCLISWVNLNSNTYKILYMRQLLGWTERNISVDLSTYILIDQCRSIYIHIYFPSQSPDHHCFIWFMFFSKSDL